MFPAFPDAGPLASIHGKTLTVRGFFVLCDSIHNFTRCRKTLHPVIVRKIFQISHVTTRGNQIMKTLIVLFALLCVATLTLAAVPQMTSYQGNLANSAGSLM
jgi:hypothetical protein